MIVDVTLPAGRLSVMYGGSKLGADDTRVLSIPEYVAKTVLTLPGTTGPDLSAQTAAQYLAATTSDDEFEANYIFWAYGKPVPDTDPVAAGVTLITNAGEPIAGWGT